MNKIILSIILLLVYSTAAFPATYWVSPTGTQTNISNCTGTDSEAAYASGSGACIYTAMQNNSSIGAGDTVYFRAGTYTTNSSVNDGSALYFNNNMYGASGNVLTFSGYGNEEVIFQYIGGASSQYSNWAIYMGYMGSNIQENNDYIKITKLNFYYFNRGLYIYGGDHNEISYCNFKGPSTDVETAEGVWAYSRIMAGGQYNWIHHNTFKNFGWMGYTYVDHCRYAADEGGAASGYANGNIFELSWENESTNNLNVFYNLVEYNEFGRAAHHTVGVHGRKNVVRKNYVHNENWMPDDGPPNCHADRLMFFKGFDANHSGRNLVENNRFAYAGQHPESTSSCSGSMLSVASQENIIRFNEGIKGPTYAYYVNGGYLSGGRTTYPIHNAVYNNTFWDIGNWFPLFNGDAEPPMYDACRNFRGGIRVGYDAVGADNNFINNLFYDAETYWSGDNDYYLIYTYFPLALPVNQVMRANWLDSYGTPNGGDPKFVDITNPDSGDPDYASPWDFNMSSLQWNLSLQADSGAVDNGSYLTTVTSVTDSDTIVVANANFFFDGWGMTDVGPNPGTATIEADWICLTESSTTVDYNHCVQIDSIDYDNLIINTTSAHGASAGWYVWLYKNSEGSVVLAGTAPDQGAKEYGTGDTTAPTIGTPTPNGNTLPCTTNPRSAEISAPVTDDTDDPSDCTCEYSTTEGFAIGEGSAMSESGGVFSATVNGLACGSDFSYFMKCKDTSDNSSENTMIAFDVLNAPVIGGIGLQ